MAAGNAEAIAGWPQIVDNIKVKTDNIEVKTTDLTLRGAAMKIKEVMSANPVCCTANDSAQNVAKVMCDLNVGSIPVVVDQQTRALVGMITDRDLCCRVLAHGLDSNTTKIQEFVTYNPATVRDGDNVERCERLMQEHQVRRIPVVDGDNRVIGIVAQADVALRDRPERVHKTVAEISKTTRPTISAA